MLMVLRQKKHTRHFLVIPPFLSYRFNKIANEGKYIILTKLLSLPRELFEAVVREVKDTARTKSRRRNW